MTSSSSSPGDAGGATAANDASGETAANDAHPTRVVSIRTIAMPSDTNPAGDIFGGWLMAQMDLAGGTRARKESRGRVATVAVTGFTFHKPVRIGDELTCYTEILKRGRTSITILVEAWVCRQDGGATEKVTDGTFVFVALDRHGTPRPLDAPE